LGGSCLAGSCVAYKQARSTNGMLCEEALALSNTQPFTPHCTPLHTHRRRKNRGETMLMDMCTAAARGRVDRINALIAEDEEEAIRVRWFDG